MPTEQTFISGAKLDTRTEEQKKKDYKFEEIVAQAAPVNWVEKTQDQWRTFPIYNQDGSGSCVAQTQAKELGIMRYLKDSNYVHFSATDIYQRRFNKPDGGMQAFDARSIARKGTTLEVLVPSQNMNDSQMDAVVIEPYKREVGKVFITSNSVDLPIGDIETVASLIQTTGKGVMVWFYFRHDEWGREVPVVLYTDVQLYNPSTTRHSVTATDFFIYQGKKALLIEDSAHFGGITRRIVTEDFYKARNFFAGYLVNFQFEDSTPTPSPKPSYTFTKDLSFGMTDPDVKGLQEILRYEGMFPTNASITSYFGAVTKKGVEQFQVKYGVASSGMTGFGRVGPKTRTKLNELYGN